MLWSHAVKIWNQHKKGVNPAHVYCLPRKGTPEHAHVKHIQAGGDPEKFGEPEKKAEPPKKFTEHIKKREKLAEIAGKIKRSAAARSIAKAVKAHAEKKKEKMEIDLKKLPEDVEEHVIKKMVGDPNKEKAMERFKTQMKGLEKLINLLKKDLDEEGRSHYARHNVRKHEEGAPEYIQRILKRIRNVSEKKRDDEMIVDGEDLSDWVEVLEKIHKAGKKLLDGKEDETLLWKREDVEPYEYYQSNFSLEDLNRLEDVFALNLSIYSEVEEKRPENEEEFDEDEEYPYDYYLYGKFSTYEETKDYEKKEQERQRESAVSSLAYRLKEAIKKAKVAKALKKFVAGRKFPPMEEVDDFNVLEVGNQEFGVNKFGDVIDDRSMWKGKFDFEKKTLDLKAKPPRYWNAWKKYKIRTAPAPKPAVSPEAKERAELIAKIKAYNKANKGKSKVKNFMNAPTAALKEFIAKKGL